MIYSTILMVIATNKNQYFVWNGMGILQKVVELTIEKVVCTNLMGNVWVTHNIFFNQHFWLV